MNELERLNRLNDMEIHDGLSEDFHTYGRIITGYDFHEMIQVMSDTEIPEQGNMYIPSYHALENCSVLKEIRTVFYGDMPLQAGYCNGVNSTYNGFEYHKGSEINVACTDMMLVLGHVWQIHDNHFDSNDAKVFFFPANTALELYQTTLHLSPCRTRTEGYRTIVILPQGTNTELTEKPVTDDPESKLLLKRNKWVLAHPQRKQLIDQGAFPGVTGENIELIFQEKENA